MIEVASSDPNAPPVQPLGENLNIDNEKKKKLRLIMDSLD